MRNIQSLHWMICLRNNETAQIYKTTIIADFVIHLERTDKDAGAKRARYNSALMDADITVLGEELFNDEEHIIYVNGEYKGNDPIGDLMHDFHCKKADDMKSKILADRVRYLKEDEKGVTHMCRIMEEFAKEERAERDLETAVKLIEQGKMTEEEVAEFYHFTKAQMKLVKEKVAVLA